MNKIFFILLAITMTVSGCININVPKDESRTNNPLDISPTPKDIITCGPFGGGGGDSFRESFETPPIGLNIRAGTYVDSIQMVYNTGPGNRWGGGGGGAYPINLNPGEYVQGISIWSGLYVDSITIFTNSRVFGPYGGGGGKQQPMCGGPGWQVIGIYGQSGLYVDSLGVTLQRR